MQGVGVKAADVADELLDKVEFFASGGCLAFDKADLAAFVGVDLFDRCYRIHIVEVDGDDVACGYFRFEDTHSFGLLANVIPGLIVKGGNGGRRAPFLLDIGTGGKVGLNVGQLALNDQVAPGFNRRGAGRNRDGKSHPCHQAVKKGGTVFSVIFIFGHVNPR